MATLDASLPYRERDAAWKKQISKSAFHPSFNKTAGSLIATLNLPRSAGKRENSSTKLAGGGGGNVAGREKKLKMKSGAVTHRQRWGARVRDGALQGARAGKQAWLIPARLLGEGHRGFRKAGTGHSPEQRGGTGAWGGGERRATAGAWGEARWAPEGRAKRGGKRRAPEERREAAGAWGEGEERRETAGAWGEAGGGAPLPRPPTHIHTHTPRRRPGRTSWKSSRL